MSVAQNHAQTFLSGGVSPLPPAAAAATDDPVTLRLRESARRMIGIAAFSGVINILMLSGSLYMLQVYDRVIPSRNTATLLGLSLMVLFAYLVQGYFAALRARMLWRGATRAAMDSSAQRQVLADATQPTGEVLRALGQTDRFDARWSQANERYL